MRLVLAATGASGAIYLQRLLHYLDGPEHEVHLVRSTYAKQVINEELDELNLPANVTEHSDKSMNAPLPAAAHRFDAMIVVPCSMGTMARIAHGTSESLILRAAGCVPQGAAQAHPRTAGNALEPGSRPQRQVCNRGRSDPPARVTPHFTVGPKTFEELADTVSLAHPRSNRHRRAQCLPLEED